MRRPLSVVLVSLLPLVPTAAAQNATEPLAPTKPVQQPSQPEGSAKAKKAAKTPVYDEKANARTQIDAALVSAAKNNRRVLIQWGANWCGWCTKLHDTFASNKDVAKKLNYEYDVIYIDVGQFDKHIDVATSYGADLKAKGLPYLTILDASGKVIANQETGSLEKGAAHDPDKVMSFLTKNQAEYPKAEDVLNAGLAKAKAEKKAVLLHFGAPWCIWCHRMETWMDQPNVGPVLAKDFVDLKIDQDRTLGADAIMTRYNPKPNGIPWFAFLDAEGKLIADSNGPHGNIGFPAQPDEIEHFAAMLRKAKRSLSDSEVDALLESLKPKKKAG